MQKLVSLGEFSESFAKHFASHFKEKPSPKDIRGIAKMEVLWQGNPISLMISFGKHSCQLCMQEQVLILKATHDAPAELINLCSEIMAHVGTAQGFTDTRPALMIILNVKEVQTRRYLRSVTAVPTAPAHLWMSNGYLGGRVELLI